MSTTGHSKKPAYRKVAGFFSPKCPEKIRVLFDGKVYVVTGIQRKEYEARFPNIDMASLLCELDVSAVPIKTANKAKRYIEEFLFFASAAR